MASKILPFVVADVAAPPSWECGPINGIPAHVWAPGARPGDRCTCGTCTLPVLKNPWFPKMPTAAEAEAEATAS